MAWKDSFIACMIAQSAFFNQNMYSEEKSVHYTAYAIEVLNSFIDEMECRFGFSCMGSGGSMPYNVRSLTVMFSSNKKIDTTQARQLGIATVKSLLEAVNNHECIRPYLYQYPFTANDINVSISFFDRRGKRRLKDGSITAVRLLSGKVFYEVAEMKTIHSQGVICGETGKYLIPPKDKKKIELKEILRETYEEAEAIVEKEKRSM